MYSFHFDKSIDSDYMQTMYEGEYRYIEEIFNITLTHFPEDISAADQKYNSGDIEGVRKAIHKIKSTFGFIGMIELQNSCQDIEQKWSSGYSLDELKSEIESLLRQISIHRIILQNESVRLKNFNSTSL